MNPNRAARIAAIILAIAGLAAMVAAGVVATHQFRVTVRPAGQFKCGSVLFPKDPRNRVGNRATRSRRAPAGVHALPEHQQRPDPHGHHLPAGRRDSAADRADAPGAEPPVPAISPARQAATRFAERGLDARRLGALTRAGTGGEAWANRSRGHLMRPFGQGRPNRTRRPEAANGSPTDAAPPPIGKTVHRTRRIRIYVQARGS